MRGNASDQETVLRSRKKTATVVIRILLGVLFLFSGLTKLNDPMGLVFKMQEYLPEGIFGPQLLVDIAGTIITLEIVLGAILLIGRFKILALSVLLIIISGFTLLTFYSAATGSTPDCGCFGDVITLSPWASFFKNLVILALAALLVLWRRFIKPVLGFRTSMSIVAALFALSLGICYYVLRNEPIIDFRPYKVGTDIKKERETPLGKDRPIFENRWVYRIDGKNRTYTDRQEPWNISGAEFVSRQTKLVSGKLPDLDGLVILSPQGEDITDSLLSMGEVLWITCYNKKSIRKEKWERINAYVEEKGVPVYLLIHSGDEAYFRQYKIKMPVCLVDATTLKTMLRSNPGIVELKNGVITAKYSYFNLPRRGSGSPRNNP